MGLDNFANTVQGWFSSGLGNLTYWFAKTGVNLGTSSALSIAKRAAQTPDWILEKIAVQLQDSPPPFKIYEVLKANIATPTLQLFEKANSFATEALTSPELAKFNKANSIDFQASDLIGPTALHILSSYKTAENGQEALRNFWDLITFKRSSLSSTEVTIPNCELSSCNVRVITQTHNTVPKLCTKILSSSIWTLIWGYTHYYTATGIKNALVEVSRDSANAEMLLNRLTIASIALPIIGQLARIVYNKIKQETDVVIVDGIPFSRETQSSADKQYPEIGNGLEDVFNITDFDLYSEKPNAFEETAADSESPSGLTIPTRKGHWIDEYMSGPPKHYDIPAE